MKITVPENESIENVLRRFKKAVGQSSHLVELRFKEFHESTGEKRKRKRDRALVLNKIERSNDRYENRYEQEYNS